jgi:hypothetical protein
MIGSTSFSRQLPQVTPDGVRPHPSRYGPSDMRPKRRRPYRPLRAFSQGHEVGTGTLRSPSCTHTCPSASHRNVRSLSLTPEPAGSSTSQTSTTRSILGRQSGICLAVPNTLRGQPPPAVEGQSEGPVSGRRNCPRPPPSCRAPGNEPGMNYGAWKPLDAELKAHITTWQVRPSRLLKSLFSDLLASTHVFANLSRSW